MKIGALFAAAHSKMRRPKEIFKRKEGAPSAEIKITHTTVINMSSFLYVNTKKYTDLASENFDFE